MNPEIFAEFLSRQGHCVVKTDTCYWYNARPGFYFYFPYHRLISPSIEELKQILWDQRCIGLRFFTPTQCVGRISYLIVCTDKTYDLQNLHLKARNQTRRGLENFEVTQLSFGDLARFGNRLNLDTLKRQGRDVSAWTERSWTSYCDAAGGLAGFDAWAVFRDGRMASFLVGFQMEDHFTILHQSSATEYLYLYPNNALVFTVTKLKLSLPEIDTVCYGPQSLDAPESLDAFKFKMGFQQRPMKQRIVFNPLIEPFVGYPLHKCLRLAAAARPQSDILGKLEGIIRCYREAT